MKGGRETDPLSRSLDNPWEASRRRAFHGSYLARVPRSHFRESAPLDQSETLSAANDLELTTAVRSGDFAGIVHCCILFAGLGTWLCPFWIRPLVMSLLVPPLGYVPYCLGYRPANDPSLSPGGACQPPLSYAIAVLLDGGLNW